MSTKIYTLTFTAGQTQILPQGRFWMIKAAASALNIEARKRSSQPTTFDGVGAGVKFNGLESDRWYELHITSAAVQTVEIVLSDDSTVDFSSAVSVVGAAVFQDQPASALATPAPDVIATGAALSVPASATRRRITISSDPTGTGNVYIQAVAAGAGRGIPLQPGNYVEVKGSYAFDVRNDSGVSVTVTRFEES